MRVVPSVRQLPATDGACPDSDPHITSPSPSPLQRAYNLIPRSFSCPFLLRSFLPSAGRFHSISPFFFRLMLLINSPIPTIRITPAPPEKSRPDPYSPFSSAKLDIEDDGYRANRLSLPPLANSSLWHSSPLRPADCQRHKGLSRDQFNTLLKVSRDQRAKFGSQKVPDLRRELALKNQSLKQRTCLLATLGRA